MRIDATDNSIDMKGVFGHSNPPPLVAVGSYVDIFATYNCTY